MWVGRQPIAVLTDPEHIRYAGNKVMNRVVCASWALSSCLLCLCAQCASLSTMPLCHWLMQPFLHILRGTHKELIEATLLFARYGGLTLRHFSAQAAAPLTSGKPVGHCMSCRQLQSLNLNPLLLACRDEMCPTLRKAWQPVCSASSLAGYMALMEG